jgi:hypothetical protein
MKKIGLFILALLILPFVLAINVEVTEKTDNLMIIGDNQPINATILIKNNGESSTFNIYNLVGFNMEVLPFKINKDKQKEVSMIITPREKMTMRGIYALEYFIRDQEGSEVSEIIKLRILEPKDAFEVGAEDINLDQEKLTIYIKNKEDYDFGKISVKFSSELFGFEKEITIGPNGKENFELELDKEDIKKLVAGFYTIKTEVTTLGQTGIVEGKVRFVEKNSVETTNEETGLIIQTQTIEKINNGNTIVKPEVVVNKNIFTRFFTVTEPKADLIERDGLLVKYSWIQEIKPSQTAKITITTNWLFPIILLILLVLITYLIIRFNRTDVLVRKKVNYVKTKGGEFALRVTIFVKAQNYIERLNLIEKIPCLVKVYPRFGGEQPIRVDEEKRRIDWRFEKMEAGEVRKITYVIYSKVGVLGRFVLPKAKAVYEKNGVIKEVRSNKSFFASRKDIRE